MGRGLGDRNHLVSDLADHGGALDHLASDRGAGDRRFVAVEQRRMVM